MNKKKLFLDCVRRPVEAHQRGTFDRWQTVALIATCIEFRMREESPDQANADVRDPGAVPVLELKEPLSADDRLLQELYAEAVTFWAAGYGRLRLLK